MDLLSNLNFLTALFMFLAYVHVVKGKKKCNRWFTAAAAAAVYMCDPDQQKCVVRMITEQNLLCRLVEGVTSGKQRSETWLMFRSFMYKPC